MNTTTTQPDVQLDLSILCPDAEDLPELAGRWAREDVRAGEPSNATPFDGTPAAVAAYNEVYDELDEVLAAFRAQPVVYLTDAELEEIERERPGEEICNRPWEW